MAISAPHLPPSASFDPLPRWTPHPGLSGVKVKDAHLLLPNPLTFLWSTSAPDPVQ